MSETLVCPVCQNVLQLCMPDFQGRNWYYCSACGEDGVYWHESDLAQIEYAQADADWHDLKDTELSLRAGLYS